MSSATASANFKSPPDQASPTFAHISLHLLIQSSLCSEARTIIAGFIEASLAIPLSRAFGHSDMGRAHFALSLLSGFVTHRAVLCPQDLVSIPEEDQYHMLEMALLNAMMPPDGP